MNSMSGISLWKKAFFVGVLVVFLFVLAEAVTRLVRHFTVPLTAEIGVDSLEPAPYVVHRVPSFLHDGPYVTNAYGFRNGPIDPVAASGTYRIVMLGGSAVFGLGATSNTSTIPAQLEHALQLRFPERHIEVINAGQPWYNSTQELVQYQTLLSRFHPNMVVVMDGYNDFYYGRENGEPGMPAVWRTHQMEQALRLVMSPHLTLADIHRPIGKLVLQSAFLYTVLKEVRTVAKNNDFAGAGETTRQNRDGELGEIYLRNQRYIAVTAQANGAAYLHAIQPVLVDRSERLPDEEVFLGVPADRADILAVQHLMETVRTPMKAIAAEVGGDSIDLRPLLGGDLQLFVDQVHLSDEANLRIANRFADVVGGYVRQ